MSEEVLQQEMARLGRKIRNTRIGLVFGLGALGVGAYYGVRHLGEQHHEVFSEMYRDHKRSGDPRSWTDCIRENLPIINLPEKPSPNPPPAPDYVPMNPSPSIVSAKKTSKQSDRTSK